MNEFRLKSLISKKALGDSDNSQKLFQMFYFERILERISLSKYRGQIILKGGMLLSSIIGEDERTTKDMDATLKGITLSKEKIEEVFNDILNMELDDGVTFQIVNIKDIRMDDIYGGFRLNILAKLGNNKTYVAVELTTGDIITPREMNYSYKCMFEDKRISIMSYNIETILAEKLHAIITRGVLNTRMKDFYDVYILINTKEDIIDFNNLELAIKNTFKKRVAKYDVEEFKLILSELKESEELAKLWILYQDKNKYARLINYDDTLNAVDRLIQIIEYV